MAIEHIMDPALSRIPEGKLADKWTRIQPISVNSTSS